jgi:hypothetical protein
MCDLASHGVNQKCAAAGGDRRDRGRQARHEDGERDAILAFGTHSAGLSHKPIGHRTLQSGCRARAGAGEPVVSQAKAERTARLCSARVKALRHSATFRA